MSAGRANPYGWTPEELAWLAPPHDRSRWLTPDEWHRRAETRRARARAERAQAEAQAAHTTRHAANALPDPALTRALQELEQARSQIRQLEDACAAAWAAERRARADCDAAEADARQGWTAAVRAILEGDPMPPDLLRRLIAFVHPDKHQRATPDVQAAAHDLTVELIKLKNGEA